MHIVLWILLCLFACVGFVYGLSWLVCSAGRPKQSGRAYQVIPLERDPDILEQQLRYEIQLLRWSATPRLEILILLDTGLGEEARAICQGLIGHLGGVIICEPDELPGLITGAQGVLAKEGT